MTGGTGKDVDCAGNSQADSHQGSSAANFHLLGVDGTLGDEERFAHSSGDMVGCSCHTWLSGEGRIRECFLQDVGLIKS